ncbi:O-antigen ligase family protein [Microbacterium caowuchunii]|uniref:O-antigen ligase family protein n=1 Tax=Microbacterium caowuchunii TaxID=2614638 RepID=UPI00177F9FFB|nr:O-antigen ligase family protein [Microbacterium caowuchunii]
MIAPDAGTAPVAAQEHRGLGRPRRFTAPALLIVYVVLLFAVPSNIAIAGMGGLGRPAMLWALMLLVWWVLSHLQRQGEDVPPPMQPVRWALGALAVIVLLSFAAALLRGQPAEQVSPALTAIIRFGSWCGVVLVTMDGVRTHNDVVRIVRVLVIATGCMAVLGVAQFLMGSSLLEWVGSVPGLSYDWGGIDSRGQFIRAAGTATHPLEFVAALVTVLPVALAVAITGGLTRHHSKPWLWWGIVILMLFVCLISVSRSAIIGVVVAMAMFLPWMPRGYRAVGAVGAVGAAVAVVALVPGMWSATVTLFVGVAEDSSTQSRTGALERIPDFLASSPLIGQGWGTFTSRYYVFDNQWAGLLIEIGVAGVLALLGLIVSAVWSAVSAGQGTPFADTRILSGAVASGLVAMAVVLFLFDGISFPIAAGVFFLLIGLSAALRRIVVSDMALAESRRLVGRERR